MSDLFGNHIVGFPTKRPKFWIRVPTCRNSNQRTIGPENAHLKPDPGVHVLSHHEMTLTLNTHTPLLNS